MATKRGLSHLQALVALQERADREIIGLASTLTAANDQIDAILEDSDREVAETVSESYSPGEVLSLAQQPVKEGTVTLAINGSPVSSDAYSVDLATGVITPNAQPGEGVTITAEYTVAGLASQAVELLATIPELSGQDFLDKQESYATAIAWIRANYGE